MSTIKTTDGCNIFYKDWGTGPTVLFSHGWPLNADAWEKQMMFLADNGFRVIAHDRRGHGRSDQSWQGHTMDTYADDLGQLIDALKLTNVTLIGHSMGGGEVARYVGRHGTGKVAAMVLIGAVTPLTMQTKNNPEGVPMAMLDKIREGVRADRSQFYMDFSGSFFGANRMLKELGASITGKNKASQGMRDAFWLMAMHGSLKAQYESVAQFSETDFTADLQKIDVPTLILHGDDDQAVPIDATARKAVKLIEGATLKVYEGGDHGLPATHGDELNTDLLSFLQSL